MSLPDLTEKLAAAARDLSAEDVGQTLEKSVALCVDLIEGCDAAAVSLVRRSQSIETPSSTDPRVLRGDELQYELQQGPCMGAVWHHDIVISTDLATDDRWPQWAPRVVEDLGVRSMMCLQLFTDATTLGALNMYSWRPDAFSVSGDRDEGLALGAHVAVALVAAQQLEGLNTALVNRTVIGQAEGILMERFGITADQAFQVLRRVSSHSNTKLQRVATELVETRQLPPT
jgi:transcriptional regulator with GAF, ATPase, and Fis domain